ELSDHLGVEGLGICYEDVEVFRGGGDPLRGHLPDLRCAAVDGVRLPDEHLFNLRGGLPDVQDPGEVRINFDGGAEARDVPTDVADGADGRPVHGRGADFDTELRDPG